MESFAIMRFASDVKLICGDNPSGCYWEDMGKADKVKASPPAKEEPAKDGLPATSKTHHLAEGLGKLHLPNLLKKKSSCGTTCLKILYIILAIIVILKAIAVIVVAVTTAIATKIYSTELSGRLVSMIILAVTAAITLTVVISAIVSVCRKKKKALYAASMVLIILAAIQAILVGVAVRVTPEDELNLSRSLTESFNLAREDNPRHLKIWATTQHDLTCCGVYSAEDYRSPRVPYYFPPDVPISCCPSYDPGRSELVQEREREICKARKTFYDAGCKNLVIEVFKETAKMVLCVTIVFIILEVLLAILGVILAREKKNKEQKNTSPELGAHAETNTPPPKSKK